LTLEGTMMPDVTLPATGGGFTNPRRIKGRAVYFIYPYTGRPGVPDPEGWDQIKGAHGSTPQALSYSKAYEDFILNNVRVFGVSLQDSAWQLEFVSRTALPFPLLSDAARQFSTGLSLQTFPAGNRDFLHRRTLVASEGAIILDRTDVSPPESDAALVLTWLEERT